MNRLKICFIIEAIIVTILIIALPFTQNYNFDQSQLALYITGKIVFGLIFVSSVIYGLLSKAKTGSSTAVVAIAAIFQLVPIGIAQLAKQDFNQKWLVTILIIAICLMVYCGLIFGLSYQDKKMVQKDSETEAREISVEEEKRILK